MFPDPLVLQRYDLSTNGVRYVGSLGGLSGAEFWQVSRKPTGLLKRFRQGSLGPSQIKQIHLIQNRAIEGGLHYVTSPIQTTDGATFVESEGVVWELSRWLPGESDVAGALGSARLNDAATKTARLHRSMTTGAGQGSVIGAPSSLAKRRRLADEAANAAWLGSAVLEAEPNCASPELLLSLSRIVRQRLPGVSESLGRISGIECPVQSIHGDTRRDNLLFTGDELTGLLDFGAVTRDSPMVDLARLLWDACPAEAATRQAAIAAYESVRPLTDAESVLLPVLESSGPVLAAFNWLRWLVAEKRSFPQPRAVQARLLTLVERLLKHDSKSPGLVEES